MATLKSGTLKFDSNTDAVPMVFIADHTDETLKTVSTNTTVGIFWGYNNTINEWEFVFQIDLGSEKYQHAFGIRSDGSTHKVRARGFANNTWSNWSEKS